MPILAMERMEKNYHFYSSTPQDGKELDRETTEANRLLGNYQFWDNRNAALESNRI